MLLNVGLFNTISLIILISALQNVDLIAYRSKIKLHAGHVRTHTFLQFPMFKLVMLSMILQQLMQFNVQVCVRKSKTNDNRLLLYFFTAPCFWNDLLPEFRNFYSRPPNTSDNQLCRVGCSGPRGLRKFDFRFTYRHYFTSSAFGHYLKK